MALITYNACSRIGVLHPCFSTRRWHCRASGRKNPLACMAVSLAKGLPDRQWQFYSEGFNFHQRTRATAGVEVAIDDVKLHGALLTYPTEENRGSLCTGSIKYFQLRCWFRSSLSFLLWPPYCETILAWRRSESSPSSYLTYRVLCCV
jgi:hypothetical protein